MSVPTSYPVGPKTKTRPLEGQAAGVERGRVELSAELLDCAGDIVVEDVLHHSDLRVIVEGQVDVLVCDEVDRDPDSSPQPQAKRTRNTAGWAAPGSRSTCRKADSLTLVSPRAGQANVYRVVSASYTSWL